MKLTERHIQDLLWNRLRSAGQEWMCPNLHVPGWFEIDFFSLTTAGFMVEHEIKLSVSDFRADSRKSCFVHERDEHGKQILWKGEQRTKHGRIALGDTHGPRIFWYVCPEEMLQPADVPVWAGLKWATRYNLQIKKQAPRLHSTPVSQAVRDHLHLSLLYRYWGNRTRDPGGPMEYQI